MSKSTASKKKLRMLSVCTLDCIFCGEKESPITFNLVSQITVDERQDFDLSITFVHFIPVCWEGSKLHWSCSCQRLQSPCRFRYLLLDIIARLHRQQFRSYYWNRHECWLFGHLSFLGFWCVCVFSFCSDLTGSIKVFYSTHLYTALWTALLLSWIQWAIFWFCDKYTILQIY